MTRSASLDRDALALHRALTDLIRVYQFRDRDCVCCYDLSVTQSHALDRLRQLGPLTLNDLAGALYLEKSTVSRLVDGLERRGLVLRHAHPDDGRRILVALTKSGVSLCETVEADLAMEEARLLENFSHRERLAIKNGIERLAAAAAARIHVSSGSCERIE